MDISSLGFYQPHVFVNMFNLLLSNSPIIFLNCGIREIGAQCSYTFNKSKIDVITVSGCFAFITVYNIYNFSLVKGTYFSYL